MAESKWNEMKPAFGTVPYRGYRYGPVSGADVRRISAKLSETTDELARLRLILELLKKGDFSASNLLVPLFESRSRDVRLYAGQLFADVCSHNQVHHLKTCLLQAEDPDESFAVILFLGHTFSLQAVPLLWQFRQDIGDYPEFNGYIHSALTDILSLDGVDEYSLDDPEAREALDREVMSLESKQYYYEGHLIFAGDLTKRIITYAAIGNREEQKFELSFEPKALSNLSGINCPIRYGMEVPDIVFRGVIDYTKQIARMKWIKGMKYFYGRPVGP